MEMSVMIAQRDSSLSVLPVARVQFPATAEYFKEFFPGWSHSANPSWASVAENGSISPQRHYTTCGQRGGRPKFNRGQMMADRKKWKLMIRDDGSHGNKIFLFIYRQSLQKVCAINFVSCIQPNQQRSGILKWLRPFARKLCVIK